jgi:type II secretory pathway component GspD/PulD (secretin)
MKRIAIVMVAALLMAGAAGASPDALDRKVSLDLQDATVEEAFRSLAHVAGVQISLEGVTGEKVSLELENVRVRTILSALCDSLGCRWELAGDKLRVVPVPGERPAPRVKPTLESLAAVIDLKVTNASVRDLLETVAQIMSARPIIDSAIEGKITLEVENTEVEKVLDTACASARCEWSLDAEKGILVVRPKAQK